MSNKAVVMVVEDMRRFWEPIQKELVESGLVAEVLVADTIDKARAAFGEHKDRVAAILMDACVDNDDDIDTEDLIRDMRKEFSGPMIAMSRDPYFRSVQQRAGCDHEAPKYTVAQYLIKHLSENRA